MSFWEDHAGDDSLAKWRLLQIDLPSVRRFTDCEIPIQWNSHEWIPAALVSGSVSMQPEQQTADFLIADGQNELFPDVYDTNGAQGIKVAIYEAAFLSTNKSAAPDAVRQIYAGRVQSSTKSRDGRRDVVEFRCGPPVIQNSVTVPLRLVSSLVRKP